MFPLQENTQAPDISADDMVSEGAPIYDTSEDDLEGGSADERGDDAAAPKGGEEDKEGLTSFAS
jgi:hypothetical protein